jgi:hypothetical protein
MSKAQRPLMIGSAALALFLAASFVGSDAFARHGSWGIGVHVRGRVFVPPVVVDVQSYPSYPAYPPPPPPCCYAPPPVMVQAPAQPPTVPVVGLAVAGVGHAPSSGQLPVGGLVGALQFRTSSHSLLALELQSLSARRLSDDTRRQEVAGLLAGRVFLWDAQLAPYLEGAVGLGSARIQAGGSELRAGQFLGRYGLGLELRIGRHVAFEGQISRVHKLRLDSDEDRVAYDGLSGPSDRSIGEHERAIEFRGGLAVRF